MFAHPAGLGLMIMMALLLVLVLVLVLMLMLIVHGGNRRHQSQRRCQRRSQSHREGRLARPVLLPHSVLLMRLVRMSWSS
jgi:uncharacterized membrane protein